MRLPMMFLLPAAPLAAMEVQILTPPANTMSFGRILAVSADGNQMAGEAIVLAGLGREAVTWSATGGMVFAAISPTDPALEIATGISSDGKVVAGWQRTTRDNGFVRRTGGSNPTLVNFKDYRVCALARDGSIAVGTAPTLGPAPAVPQPPPTLQVLYCTALLPLMVTPSQPTREMA